MCGSDGITYSNPCLLNIANCESGGAVVLMSEGRYESFQDTSRNIDQ